MPLLEVDSTSSTTVSIQKDGPEFDGQHFWSVEQIDRYENFLYTNIEVRSPDPGGPPPRHQSTATVR